MAPMIAPMLVPVTMSMGMPCFSNPAMTPMWEKARAAPPPRARPILQGRDILLRCVGPPAGLGKIRGAFLENGANSVEAKF
jgi:hypothetical protein